MGCGGSKAEAGTPAKEPAPADGKTQGILGKEGELAQPGDGEKQAGTARQDDAPQAGKLHLYYGKQGKLDFGYCKVATDESVEKKVDSPRGEGFSVFVDESVEKKVDSPRGEGFSVFVDGSCIGASLIATDDGTMLQIADVAGGALGLWNNRGRTEKVRCGDLVFKVRTAAADAVGEWVQGDAALMLKTLQAAAVSEVRVKRGEEPKPLVKEGDIVASGGDERLVDEKVDTSDDKGGACGGFFCGA